MKLVVCITFFDGEELLDACIQNYKKFCDKVVICYQSVSNTGIIRDVFSHVEKYIIDPNIEVIDFSPNLNLSIKENEMIKHTTMVNEAKRLGGTHFIISATDHFYDPADVEKVKTFAEQYDSTYTKVHTYYKEPIFQITPLVPWKMPFICKLYPETEITKVSNFPLYVDPACKVNTYGNWYLFDEDEIVLHNYSNVRNNLEEKLKNNYFPLLWSTKKKKAIVEQWKNYTKEKIGEPLLYYNHGERGVTTNVVPNYFGL